MHLNNLLYYMPQYDKDTIINNFNNSIVMYLS
jgi:hypothetical protein